MYDRQNQRSKTAKGAMVLWEGRVRKQQNQS